MPVISSEYKALNYPFAGDIQTILPALFRKAGNVFYTRERIVTPDNDFLDLDWNRNKTGNRLAIISHGLEGSSNTPYTLGMARAFHLNNWSVLAWNYRGCSGEINKQHRFYHSGETGDLDFVIHHALEQQNYKEVVLIGFSVGGNITLKYLGEKAYRIHKKIRKGIVFSVPCDLTASAQQLAKFRTRIYMQRFIKSLRKKILDKAVLYPDLLDIEGLYDIKNFYEFDEKYTAPIHGFASAKEYWRKNSSIYYIKNITIPTLIINARNDPFLTPACFPIKEAEANELVYLEMPKAGGHCGFYEKNKEGIYWSEKRALQFLSENFSLKNI